MAEFTALRAASWNPSCGGVAVGSPVIPGMAAATRAPARVDAATDAESRNARPYSIEPNVSRHRSGMMIAASTIVLPRSERRARDVNAFHGVVTEPPAGP